MDKEASKCNLNLVVQKLENFENKIKAYFQIGNDYDSCNFEGLLKRIVDNVVTNYKTNLLSKLNADGTYILGEVNQLTNLVTGKGAELTTKMDDLLNTVTSVVQSDLMLQSMESEVDRVILEVTNKLDSSLSDLKTNLKEQLSTKTYSLFKDYFSNTDNFGDLLDVLTARFQLIIASVFDTKISTVIDKNFREKLTSFKTNLLESAFKNENEELNKQLKKIETHQNLLFKLQMDLRNYFNLRDSDGLNILINRMENKFTTPVITKLDAAVKVIKQKQDNYTIGLKRNTQMMVEDLENLIKPRLSVLEQHVERLKQIIVTLNDILSGKLVEIQSLIETKKNPT